MTFRVGPKGQVVIPKAIRDELGISPGDRVDVERREGEVVVRLHQDSAAERRRRVAALRGLQANREGGGTKELEEMRRAERELERRKAKDRA
jgi:AbrB family looped-hinge helix DNA binding protein